MSHGRHREIRTFFQRYSWLCSKWICKAGTEFMFSTSAFILWTGMPGGLPEVEREKAWRGWIDWKTLAAEMSLWRIPKLEYECSALPGRGMAFFKIYDILHSRCKKNAISLQQKHCLEERQLDPLQQMNNKTAYLLHEIRSCCVGQRWRATVLATVHTHARTLCKRVWILFVYMCVWLQWVSCAAFVHMCRCENLWVDVYKCLSKHVFWVMRVCVCVYTYICLDTYSLFSKPLSNNWPLGGESSLSHCLMTQIPGLLCLCVTVELAPI